MKLIWINLFLIIPVYAQNQPLNNKEKETVTLEIKAMLDDFHQDILQNGLVSELWYLDHSSEFFWIPPGYSSSLNYDTIKSIVISNSKTIKVTGINWETINILPLTKTIASYSGIVKCTQKEKSNSVSLRIIESGTLIKREKHWKFLNGQSRILTEN